jgi:hypothetical protein
MNSRAKPQPAQHLVQGQRSWRLAGREVEAFVTETGGHLGPVTFDRRGRKLRPYSVAPWAEEAVDPALPAILKVLRGDFFCLPFGGNSVAYRGEKHPVHGETANARWRFESLEAGGGRACLHLSLKTRVRPGRVDKRLWVVDGQNVIYSQHLISGMSGPMNLGHHAMLKFPDTAGCGWISTSPFRYGQVFPLPFERPERGGYSWLKPGAPFRSLQQVPAANGETVDVSRYPARRGFEDLLMLVSDARAPFAWIAVSFPRERYVWFALKNPRVLRETVFWISNGGRHYAPWNGRHVNVMGFEDVTSCFHLGLAESAAKNPIAGRGFPTCLKLEPRKPLAVPYIMGVALTGPGFDRVASIVAAPGNNGIILRSAGGKDAKVKVNLGFLEREPAP